MESALWLIGIAFCARGLLDAIRLVVSLQADHERLALDRARTQILDREVRLREAEFIWAKRQEDDEDDTDQIRVVSVLDGGKADLDEDDPPPAAS